MTAAKGIAMNRTVAIVRPPEKGRATLNPAFISRLEADTLLFAVAVCILNAPLLFDGNALDFVFTTGPVLRGQWWRILTHPFVHVSWYHLILDGSAFFLLYRQLGNLPIPVRLGLFASCLAGSIAGALVATGGSVAQGLCGLSGIAHGLMAYIALRNCSRLPQERLSGATTLLFLLIKSICEWFTGIPFLNFLHFGNIGDPILAAHLGGVVAAGVFYLTALVAGKTGWKWA